MAETGGNVGTERIAALDGVRGIAVIAVVAFHAFPALVPGGFFGVEAFFVLSGFLLTRLLLAEHAGSGRIDLVAFAERRLRRLVPALWVLLVVLVVVAPLVARADAHRLPGDLGWSALGLTNWYLVVQNSSYFDQLGRPPLVRHLWSVAVELQFYLVSPFLALWAARSRRAVVVVGLVAGIAGSAVLMAVLAAGRDPSRAYYGTDTRAGALLSGVLLAVLLSRRPAAGMDRLRRAADPMAALGVTVLVLACWLGREDMGALYPFGFLAVQAATAAAIVGAVAGSASAAGLGALPLRWLGQRSYGIYLWHWPLVVVLRPGIDVEWDTATAGLVGIVAAVVLGHASYTLVERPAVAGGATLAIPRSIRPLAVASTVLLVAGVAGIVVNLPANDPIAATLRAGEQILSSQAIGSPAAVSAPPAPPAAPLSARPRPAPTATPSTTAPAATAPAATPVTPAPPPPTTLGPGPPPGTVAVTAIGDSVMLSAAGPLKDRLGPSGSIDAKVSRQFREGVEIVRSLRDEGRLAPVLVVHLGTNGPPRPAEVDAMMSAAGAGSRVLFVTVRVKRSWAEETNGVLSEAAGRHPAATLVDWEALSEGQSGWFLSDGTHLTTEGAEAYAALVGSMLPTPPPTPPPSAAPATASPPTTTPARP